MELRRLGRPEALDPVSGRDFARREDPRVDAAPSRVPRLGDPRVRAVEKRRPHGLAWAREPRDLDKHRLTEPEDVVRPDARPVEFGDRQVLAERAGLDPMTLGLERLDQLEGEETERPVGPAVEAPVAMTVPLKADSRDAGRPDRALGHAAGRDVDLGDAPGHRSVEDEDALAGGLRVEEAVGLAGLREPEAVGEEALQR